MKDACKLWGINQKGKKSVRCDDNTGPRRFVVTECDQGSLDEQAALHLYLSTILPLMLASEAGAAADDCEDVTQEALGSLLARNNEQLLSLSADAGKTLSNLEGRYLNNRSGA